MIEEVLSAPTQLIIGQPNWGQYCYIFQINPFLMNIENCSVTLSLTQYLSHAFPPGRSDSGFMMWTEKGLKKRGDLMALANGMLMSFAELVARYNIPCKHLFKYLQVKNFIRSPQSQCLSIPPLSVSETEMENDALKRVSQIHTIS